MNLPPDVTVKQYADALKNSGNPWRPGQRCDGERVWGTASCTGGHEWTEDHDIPMPAITDKLVIGMLRFLLTRPYRTITINNLSGNGSRLDAGIIFLTAKEG